MDEGHVVTCDRCTADAAWLVFAAYDIDEGTPHPQLARYPGAMYRACAGHLVVVLADDCDAPGSTGQWLVRPA